MVFAVDGNVFENVTAATAIIPGTPNYFILETAGGSRVAGWSGIAAFVARARARAARQQTTPRRITCESAWATATHPHPPRHHYHRTSSHVSRCHTHTPTHTYTPPHLCGTTLPPPPTQLSFPCGPVAWYFPPGPSAVYPATHVVDWVRVTGPPSGAPPQAAPPPLADAPESLRAPVAGR
jgi:hypothetical protein